MNFLDRFSKYTQISFFMKNLPVGVELFHAEGGRKDQHTHTHTHDEANSHLSQFCERA
jgi:hypothetical protein